MGGYNTKLLFEGNIPEMRKSLDELGQCPHTHTYKQEWYYPISRVQVCNPTDNTKPVAEGGSADEYQVQMKICLMRTLMMRAVMGKVMTVLSLEQGTLLCAILKVVPVRANYAS